MTENLFHYTSAQSLLGIIESKSIWATKIQYMNDSKEFTHAIELANSSLNSIKISSTDEKITVICNNIKNVLERTLDCNVFVICFSEVGDSLNQWRGYCPPNLGYCIGFNFRELAEQTKEQGFILRKCIYNAVEKSELIEVWVREVVDIFSQKVLGGQNIDDTSWIHDYGYIARFIKMASVMKDVSFADEKEWRLIGLVSYGVGKIELRAGKQLLVPYVPISLDFSQSANLLWKLIIGPTPHLELAMRSASVLNDKVCFTNGVTGTVIPYRDW